jgi:hypothetical protein
MWRWYQKATVVTFGAEWLVLHYREGVQLQHTEVYLWGYLGLTSFSWVQKEIEKEWM